MRKIFIFSLLIINVKLAFAYIDPGTTGMIIGGSIWPFIVGILVAVGGFFLKYFFKPIKRGVVSLWKRVKRKD